MDKGKIIRFARLPIAVDVPAMQREVAALPDRWTPHFQTRHYDGEWCVLPLRSVEGAVYPAVPCALDARDAAEIRYRATPLLAECPAIARFLDSLQCPVMSARLLSLRRGAIIKPHRDVELAFERGEARLHVAILTNPDVEFFVEDRRVVMEAGTCWYINANLTHRVANRGNADRVHLVVDCGVDDWLRDRFAEADRSYTNGRRDPGEARQMIARLRELNTATAQAIIAQLESELDDPEGLADRGGGTHEFSE